MIVVKLLEPGLERVLNGQVGMTFIVDKFTIVAKLGEKCKGVIGKVAHVRDYRFPDKKRYKPDFQIWSISADGYEIIEEVENEA